MRRVPASTCLLLGLVCTFPGVAHADPPADDAAPVEAAPEKAAPEKEKPARPKPLAEEEIDVEGLPKLRRLDIGGSLLWVSRLGEGDVDGEATGVNYAPALGFGIHARVTIIPQLQAGVYFGGSRHGVHLARGAMDVADDVTSDSLQTLWIGAKAFPTWPMSDRVRTWLALGVGWGRFEFPEMNASRDGVGAYVIRERGSSFVEFPLGVGGSIEIIDEWLSIDFELSFSPTIHQDHDSFERAQVIVGGGIDHVGPLAPAPWTFTQALGLSLLL
jgi:hypothetical protein